MALRFTVLASGSSGNVSLIEASGFSLLLDIGLGPRQLATRLAAAGASWQDVDAVLLTHTHSDHWNERTLVHLHRRRIPLYCHADHRHALQMHSTAFAALHAANLVQCYEGGEDVALAPGLRCRPVPLRHDGGSTFGFRFEGAPDLFGQACALAYAADLGSWDVALAQTLADVDLLALEFNHDVALEYTSGRQPHLIARVLGDHGHLSNEQAAALLRQTLHLSTPGRLRHLVQLHLSRDCNRPELAAETARAVLAELAADSELHTAHQDRTGPTLQLGITVDQPRRRLSRRTARPRSADAASSGQPCLPGLD
jgi:glyoxylase-like metal-dependent hydrolase (beta-lactamase superfamily II)